MTTRALSLPSSDATCALAASLAPRLRPGDVLLLDGGIGAGKTHFARCLIQSLQEEPEDVPSPTFTLVQVYDVPTGELWHTDLYRLSDPDQVVELGLTEAFEEAICLVEWPDRLEDLTPKAALSLSFEVTGDDSRRVTLSWQDPRWDALLEALDA
ncbi:tRNA (adenosine(37)-N6)-threonylcarbamoyltransferase complex ATPase subunit type 1 TsaE [Alloyangia pacifica]|uniref:tRNA (adenosine(37)-N6)-threonylcarbamoyltransferase complex ATPase subunit type 1 TsaE n=1 Tax=Alloyangia pacifica TaxID=311180 RepID=UPI001CD4C823|nr:tRNA (adenosine(37)-N6)-threonylcarbamoyltransferase complex ATPase subunit type 1 TsaE [Alloyangia pacifica]MCA0995333.1 tRNA (adenosine(37)-N6)-threonylcarbamoyltransferase complex ATPase subunit type 1 TsaE [Alloyangia pacifica]